MAAAAEETANVERNEPDLSDWMAELPARLLCEPLTNIAIPGSHNSFSYSLDPSTPVSPCSPDTVRNLVSAFGDAAKKIVHNWSVTQSLTCAQQLARGVRYLDLRVSTMPGREELFFVHGLYGNEVGTGLQEIRRFLDAHPKEVVLLDFNHLYQMSEAEHEQLVAMLVSVFDEKLCPVMDEDSAALNVLWDQGRQVVVFYHHAPTAGRHPELWPGESMPSVWPNTAEAPKMVSLLEAHHARGPLGGGARFRVWQGVLTPTGTTVLQRLGSSLRDVCGAVAIRNVRHFMRDKGTGPRGLNIVIADFVEMEDFIPSVLALNPKE